eukprot:m.144948 g.144948  ORF g.144948 m.144948 type:complete len:83 (-) comp17210_c0_seq1:66-314(-)
MDTQHPVARLWRDLERLYNQQAPVATTPDSSAQAAGVAAAPMQPLAEWSLSPEQHDVSPLDLPARPDSGTTNVAVLTRGAQL